MKFKSYTKQSSMNVATDKYELTRFTHTSHKRESFESLAIVYASSLKSFYYFSIKKDSC